MSPPRKERAFFLPHEGQAPSMPLVTLALFSVVAEAAARPPTAPSASLPPPNGTA